MVLMLTCEHASNAVPPEYRFLFAGRGASAALHSHRGHDIGARALAERLQAAMDVPLFEADATRLLVDVNRSLYHRHVFSEYSQVLSPAARLVLVDEYYWPYRRRILDHIEKRLSHGDSVLHVAVHSFTPRLNGETRNADIGLLYDSTRLGERQTCLMLAKSLIEAGGAGAGKRRPERLRVRRNYPYRGAADGLTTALRRRFAESRYQGIEIEVNQRLLGDDERAPVVAEQIAAALRRVLDGHESL